MKTRGDAQGRQGGRSPACLGRSERGGRGAEPHLPTLTVQVSRLRDGQQHLCAPQSCG